MSAFTKPNGKQTRIDLAKGRTQQLPGGQGSITFNGVDRWVRLQVSESPGKGIVLGGVFLGLIGLIGSLFVRPRRVWIRASLRGDATLVEIGGLDRSPREDLEQEVARIARELNPPGGAPA